MVLARKKKKRTNRGLWTIKEFAWNREYRSICDSRSVLSDSVTPWTAACQAPLSMGFSRQEYWSGLPCPSPRDLPDPRIKPRSPALQADSLPSEPTGKPLSKHWKWKSLSCVWLFVHPMDYTVHGILQARILEWVAIPFSRGFSRSRNWTKVTCVAGRFFTNWNIRETIVIIELLFALIPLYHDWPTENNRIHITKTTI